MDQLLGKLLKDNSDDKIFINIMCLNILVYLDCLLKLLIQQFFNYGLNVFHVITGTHLFLFDNK